MDKSKKIKFNSNLWIRSDSEILRLFECRHLKRLAFKGGVTFFTNRFGKQRESERLSTKDLLRFLFGKSEGEIHVKSKCSFGTIFGRLISN